MEKNRYDALDGLRGICALSVVLFHLRISGTATEWAFFRHADRFVEFFFVLSGFVLAHSVNKGREFNLRDFVINRSFRLFPLHISILMIFVSLEIIKFILYKKGISLGGEPFSGHTDLTELLPNIFLLQSWIVWTDPLSFNAPSWSISTEYYMYLIFAVSLMASRFKLLLWFSLALAAIILPHSVEWLTLEARRGVSCFFAGCISYAIYIKLLRTRYSGFTNFYYEILCVSLVILALSLFPDNNLIIVFLFCFSVIVFAFEKGAFSNLLKSPPVMGLGKVSFSIYMVHYLIILSFNYLFIISDKFGLTDFIEDRQNIRIIDPSSSVLGYIIIFLVVSFVLGASVISYSFIEVPGRNFGKIISDRLRARPSLISGKSRSLRKWP